jgi:hypothetical protein
MANSLESFFVSKPTVHHAPGLVLLEKDLRTAQFRSRAVLTERWPASHSSFEPKRSPGRDGVLRAAAQTMHGGCGGLCMVMHNHSAAYGVKEFNRKNGVWYRVNHLGTKKLALPARRAAQEAFRTRTVDARRAKWAQAELDLIDPPTAQRDSLGWDARAEGKQILFRFGRVGYTGWYSGTLDAYNTESEEHVIKPCNGHPDLTVNLLRCKKSVVREWQFVQDHEDIDVSLDKLN